MSSKYPALRAIALTLKILAWITALIGLVLSIYLASISRDDVAFILSFVLTLAGAAVLVLYLYASAESIYVFLDIEENTRNTLYASLLPAKERKKMLDSLMSLSAGIEAADHEEEVFVDDDDAQTDCPDCGSLVSVNAETCDACGQLLE